MKKLYVLAALLMATTAAHAGNSISVEINGNRIQIEVPRNCDSLSCMQISASGLSGSGFGLKDKSDRSDDQPDSFNDKPDRFNDKSDRFNDKPDRFNDRSDRSNDKPDRFNDRSDRSNDKPDRFNDRSDRFNDKPDRFNDRSDRFNDKSNRSNDRSDRFNDKPNRFNGRSNRFNNKPDRLDDTDVAARSDQPAPKSASDPAASDGTPASTAAASTTPAPAATNDAPAPVAVANVAPTQAAAPVEAPTTPLGVWATEGNKGNVSVEPCGPNLCGYAVKTGDKILINMRPSDNKWTGRIHDPNSGRDYDSTIAMKGPNAMRVQGCAFGGMFCGGQTWKRVS
jgi:uncharacterized protein (DUF2147 family)